MTIFSKKWNRINIILCVLALGLILLAVKTVPYNWDSMTYHLSRIAHWNQNQSVAHYGTNSLRQISSPVLAEFIGLHSYTLMKGNDLFLNLIQCVSCLTGAALVCGIAQKIKCEPLFQFIAGLLYLSAPIIFAEALTTQVDHLAALWLLGFVYVVIDFIDTEQKLCPDRYLYWKACFAGLCVSFGYLAKPSVGFGMVIFASWVLIICIKRRDKISAVLKLAAAALPAAVVPVIPELVRNFITFHAYSAPGVGQRQLVGTLNPLYLIVNLAKNLAFNLPNVYIRGSDDLLTGIVIRLAGILRVDINNEAISEDGREFALHAAQTYGHDTAVNPVIVFLFFSCILWWIVAAVQKKNRPDRIMSGYCISAAVSFLTFCTLLRWEPFVSRYMVSYLALLCPMIAVLIQKLTENLKNHSIRYAVLGIICFVCGAELLGLFLFHKKKSEHADRFPAYFIQCRGDISDYTEICNFAAGGGNFTQIGLYMSEDTYEYPIWQGLKGKIDRLEHVNIGNLSSVYEDMSYVPDCIIWLSGRPEDSVVVHGQEYTIAEEIGVGKFILVKAGR